MDTGKPPSIETELRETLLEFPCKFPIKAMGHDEAGFKSMVSDIILAHAKIYTGEDITSNPSTSGKYISITVTIEAQSKEQLDRIYQDLTACERVLIAL